MRIIAFACVAGLLPSTLAAQDSARAPSREPLPVRTFTLRHLDQEHAGRLLTPYVYEPNAAVFPGATSHEITVRASRRTLQVVDSLLRERDKPSATVMLRFQLYAAVDSGGEQLPADIGPALRSAFRFNGYRMISQGSISTSEDAVFSTTLGAAGAYGDATLYRVSGRLESIGGNTKGSLPLTIRLSEVTVAGGSGPEVFSTGLSVPLGQTMVLGSGAVGAYVPVKQASGPSRPELRTQALILAVHPDVIPAKPE
jgi:hypothetical protein